MSKRKPLPKMTEEADKATQLLVGKAPPTPAQTPTKKQEVQKSKKAKKQDDLSRIMIQVDPETRYSLDIARSNIRRLTGLKARDAGLSDIIEEAILMAIADLENYGDGSTIAKRLVKRSKEADKQ